MKKVIKYNNNRLIGIYGKILNSKNINKYI